MGFLCKYLLTELSWSWFVYTVDDPYAPLHTPINKGRESLAYLTYIVENYSRLAQTIAFIHSHKDGYPGAWHTDAPLYSNVASLQMLQTSHIQRAGYANLRCNPAVGCPAELQFTHDSGENESSTEAAVSANWSFLFPDLPMPETIGVACCAQFAVSRSQVLQQPLQRYERIRQWIIDTPLPDDISGRVMEYVWHILFGRDPVFCPDMQTCYCEVYGRC